MVLFLSATKKSVARHLQNSAPLGFQEIWAAYRDPRLARSCIVCTNVAESGITIPNVGLVISSGVQRRVSTDIRTGSTVNALQTLSKAQLLQQLGRSGRTDCGVHITMMSHDQYLSQVRSSDLAQLEESDISPMILRSLVAGRSFARLPFLCPPHPLVQTHAKEKMFPCLVTWLTGNQPYYMKGGLIPHLTKKGCFWKSMAPAVLKYRLHIDPVNSAYLNQKDKIDCGWTTPLPRVHQYDGATGIHISLGPDCADEATAEVSQISLNDEISMEFYSGHIFPASELVPTADRHHGTRLQIRAIGVQFNWTLNQEIVFSAALTGKPRRKQFFSQCCWKRCVIGTRFDYASAVSRVDWQQALHHGDLPSLQQSDSKDPLIFSPANNTEYLNVAAYLEAFWGYIWPATCHNHVPQHEEWRAPKHGGLKDDHGAPISG